MRYDWTALLPLAAQKVDDETAAGGVAPTLRRLHYLLVSDPAARVLGYVNTQQAYKGLSAQTTRARDEGRFPALVDRTRSLDPADGWGCTADMVEAMAEQFRLDRSGHVPVLIAVEKDGLLPLIESRFWWLPRTALRGYTSQSHRRALRQFVTAGHLHVVYVGDYDPSGLDIERDFSVRVGRPVSRVAVTREQVDEHNLPPAPAKDTDARTVRMLESTGEAFQVEADALDSTVLLDLLGEAITTATGVALRDDGLPDLADLDAAEEAATEVLERLAEAFASHTSDALLEALDGIGGQR